jgi:ribosomal protein S18 acetylase RimI-like enzyme
MKALLPAPHRAGVPHESSVMEPPKPLTNLMHRLATLADLDAVYSIYMDKEVVPYLGFDPMPRDDFVQVLSDLISGNSFYVVEVDGGVRGFYRAARHQGRARHAAYLGTFAVAPETRGTGLARAIIETALSRLNADGVTRVELTLEADNKRALNFYTKLGFELEGTLRSAYKRASDSHHLDELLMAKLLPPLTGRSEA